MDEQGQVQIVRVHGPYEDAIISLSELAKSVVEGQDAATKKECWTRFLDVTKPLHELAVSGMAKIEEFFRGLTK